MADISITKYKTKVTKPTASPSNPGYPTSDPIDPVNPPASGVGGGGVNTFLQLTDTPASYTGQAGLFPRVNSGETGLEFASAIGGTIASGQVAFGTGTGTIGGDSGLTWDNVNKRLGLNVTPTTTFDVSGTASSGFDAIKFKSQFSAFGFLGSDNSVSWISSGSAKTGSFIDFSSTQIRIRSNSIIFLNISNTELARFNSVGQLGIATTTPTNTLDVNGTARIRTISNATGNFLTTSATGVIQQRTAAEVRTDLGVGTSSGTINRVAKFTSTTNLGDSRLFDDGTQGYWSNQGSNCFFGGGAGAASDLASRRQTAFGTDAGKVNISQTDWTAFGNSAGLSNTTGSGWTAIGSGAGRLNVSGGSWVAVGYDAARGATGNNFVCVGYQAARELTTGNRWTALGLFAARYLSGTTTSAVSMSNGVYLGYETKISADGATNEIVIGYQVDGIASNTIVIGNSSITDNYIRGNFNITDAKNIILGTTTGTKIGTATSQKLAFWNTTPIVQPTTAVTGATLVGGGGTTITDTDTFDGYTLAQIVKALRNIGLLA